VKAERGKRDSSSERGAGSGRGERRERESRQAVETKILD